MRWTKTMAAGLFSFFLPRCFFFWLDVSTIIKRKNSTSTFRFLRLSILMFEDENSSVLIKSRMWFISSWVPFHLVLVLLRRRCPKLYGDNIEDPVPGKNGTLMKECSISSWCWVRNDVHFLHIWFRKNLDHEDHSRVAHHNGGSTYKMIMNRNWFAALEWILNESKDTKILKM